MIPAPEPERFWVDLGGKRVGEVAQVAAGWVGTADKTRESSAPLASKSMAARWVAEQG